jgi:hypothetical protein
MPKFEIKKEWKLPKVFKKKWLAALRSGDYAGAKSTLCKIEKEGEKVGYCCLGLAGAIVGIPDDRLSKGGMLTDNIIKGFENKIPLGLTGDNLVTTHLVNMNDGQKAGFKKIANWVEKFL